jgi:hypothetical protein
MSYKSARVSRYGKDSNERVFLVVLAKKGEGFAR